MSSSAHVPRPANAFICFRSRFIREQKAQLAAAGTDQPRTQQTDWSRLAGDRWHAMSAFERQEYFDMSERIAREHKAMHPDYKYQP
ncbi:high mobility group box domain-containing protein, partial [Mycena amicta]